MKRNKNVNSIGNMMILDKLPNIQKGNEPLLGGLNEYYVPLYQNHWMIVEIQQMSNNSIYFNGGIPTDKFFEERTRRITEYLKKLLTRTYINNTCEVSDMN